VSLALAGLQEQWRTVDVFLENDNLTTIFLLTDPSPTSIRVSKPQRGAICPSTCFLIFFKPSKIIFRQPKGGPWPLAPRGTPLYRRNSIITQKRSACFRRLYFRPYRLQLECETHTSSIGNNQIKKERQKLVWPWCEQKCTQLRIYGFCRAF
jgi:hypothetical protein